MTVSILNAPDLSGDRTVDGRGMVDFPLVGEVAALGRTPSEFAGDLKSRLSERYLRNPQVSVSPKALVSQQITVLGGVAQPGRYPVQGNTSLRDALAQARGISDTGADKDIVVFRTVSGQRMAARFDLREINAGRMEDPLLFPNDQVFVANDRNRQLLRDLAPLTPLAGIFYQIF
jgi:polysaccharide export outer membrane protein